MAKLRITTSLTIDEREFELSAVRAQGPGGQNVNKLATAMVLRFDIAASSLPDHYKQALLALRDRRISHGGVLVLKAQRFRTQDRNREDAIERLLDLIRRAGTRDKPRIATAPSRAARARRVDDKKRRAGVKSMRRPPPAEA